VKIRCRTNLDLHPRETWPTELPESPIVGDRILSEWSGLPLKVVSRTWLKSGDQYVLDVELHDICNRTIADFQESYQRHIKRAKG